MHEEFAAGKFTVHQTAGNFNGVWTDLALEQTYNREGKTSLFKGITQLESAREKYIKALPFMTFVSESVKQMAHMTSSQSDHHEKLRKDDMEAVLQIKRTVEEKMQNPFNPSLATDKLMNISTGQILAATTLVDAKRLGLKAMDAATTTNADKIVQPKMETFATRLKKIQKKIDSVKEVIREESAMTRALCFAQNLSDEARTEAFSYEWLEYLPSLFEPEKNGYSMRKGCKSTYLSTLQAEVADSWEPLKELPPSAADAVYVVDAMAFIQRFNTLGSSTFGQLQERYREKLLNMKPRHCTEVHFVGDQYDFGLKSLKGDERQKRESNINLPEYVPADIMKIPDWKTLLSNPCNKTNMLSYLASRWSQEESWPAGFCLVLGVNAQATRVTQTEHTDVDELYCPNHEEADTRIFAHIASCDDNNVFVIQATDTDIIVLAMYHFPRLPNVVELWVEKNDLFLSIHDLVNESAKAVGKDVLALTDTLLISYILSGCDSVSYPFKRGKKRTVKVALEHVDKHPALSNCIRHESGPSAHDQVITEARSFFCDLYGKPGYLSLDKLRAHLFASRKLDLRSLPPTEDAFHFHVLRSLCQISLYKQASLSNPVLLPPEEYGKIVDGDRLIPVMKSKPSKPSAAKLKYCKCKKKPNCLKNCPCAKAAVPCIIACACNGDREKCGRLLTDHYDDDDDEAKLITKRMSGNLLHSPLYYGIYSQMPDFCDFFYIYANLKIRGFFGFPGMRKCMKLLTCDQIQTETHMHGYFANGYFKNVSWVSWKNYDMARSVRVTKDDEVRPVTDKTFTKNIQMLLQLSPSPFVVQLIGLCGDSELLTEYHPLQTIGNINIMLRAKLRSYNNIKTRMLIAINFVKTIRFLHNHLDGPFILCDSCSLHTYLKQFLVTSDFHVVLADLDSLKKFNYNDKSNCRCKRGDIHAPEEENKSRMPRTLKRDVWRIPFIVNYIFGTNNTLSISSELYKLHKQCWSKDPEERPSTDSVIQIYETFYSSL
ncbi:Protein O-mannose kinase [Nymphon striatum]|nr:Protein O-mannose kinase [Nymphon striatum]